MAINPIQITTVDNKRKPVSFGGNPVITLMDAIDRGGFAATFILQDFLGMAAPRVGTGIYRNHDKTGKLNWDFAKKEGIREILSGPSAFIIPSGIMYCIKKLSGNANNVPIDYINALGNTFTNYAKANKSSLADAAKAKAEFYEHVFKNILYNSTDAALQGDELSKTAKNFADRLIEIEKAPTKNFWKNIRGIAQKGSAQDLKEELLEDFVNLRKRHLGSEGSKTSVRYSFGNKKLGTSFNTMLSYMDDYSKDAIKSINKKLKKTKDLNIKEFMQTFDKRRSGTRFLSNVGMWLAVVGFYTIIPKLYNKATKGRDPGLDGLQDENKPTKDVPFTGGFQKAMANLGDKVVNTNSLKKLSNNFEFDGSSMSLPAMLTLLFGFCLPPRLFNAQSNTDRKEIMFRDVTSFVAILFGAKAITKVLSDAFAKLSGLALNTKPANESITKRIWDYVWPSGGVQVLDSNSIHANYSNVEAFRDGINDMFRFVDKNGGNVGKMLNIDADIKDAATKILGKAPDKSMELKDIINKFNNAKDTDAYKKIIEILKNKDNKLVTRAKTLNSSFGFLSTICLVPALMIWISKHCEKMTKKHIAEQKENSMRDMAKQTAIPDSMRVVTNRPTMAGFLNK